MKPVFIDFEASSLSRGSWPIEVGVAWLDGANVIVESKLIRPRSRWLENDWDPESEAVHNIRRRDLDSAEPADDVTNWLFQIVGDRPLISDAPEFDQRWLDRLIDRQGPEIRDFDHLIWWAFSAEDGRIAPGRIDKVYQSMIDRRTAHRAGSDAADLCHAWKAGLRNDRV